MKIFAGLLLLFFTLSCNNDTDGNTSSAIPDTNGAAFALSNNTFTDTYTTIRDAINANPNSTIVAEVNHGLNAQNAGLELRNTRLIIFGNPALGTPVMQANQLAGIDLPQKMLVYEDSSQNVFVAFNDTSYLAARHDVAAVETLPQIQNALRNFAILGTDGTLETNEATAISVGEGIVTITSTNDFPTTYNKLRSSISNNANLQLMGEVNHRANAQTVGLELGSTSLLIFGNPTLGTPLMQNAQTTALDLPQKMLVWEDEDSVVHISYNDPNYLMGRHNISENETILAQIREALDGLATNAAN